MRDLLALLAHLMTIVATLLGPGGVKAVVVESLLIKHQLLILNRPRKRVAGSGLPPGSAWNKNRNIAPLMTNWATTTGSAATPWNSPRYHASPARIKGTLLYPHLKTARKPQ